MCKLVSTSLLDYKYTRRLCIQADALSTLPTGLPVHRQVAVQAGLIPPETNISEPTSASVPTATNTIISPTLITSTENTGYLTSDPTEPSPPTSEENSPRPNFNLASTDGQTVKDSIIKSSKLTVSVLQLFLTGVSISIPLYDIYNTYAPTSIPLIMVIRVLLFV